MPVIKWDLPQITCWIWQVRLSYFTLCINCVTSLFPFNPCSVECSALWSEQSLCGRGGRVVCRGERLSWMGLPAWRGQGSRGILLQSAVRSCGKDGAKLFLGLHRNRTRGSRNEVQHRTHPEDFRTKLSPWRWTDTGICVIVIPRDKKAKLNWTRL